jgi:hypothetical protein
MRIGILGSGDVAQTLGTAFAARGHEVTLGTRDAKKLEAWKQRAGPKASVGSFADAARHGEVLVLATLGAAADQAIDLAGAANFEGKLLIDATNQLSGSMPPDTLYGLRDSIGARVQAKLPRAKVVKAFNTVPHVRMAEPRLPGARMLVCGDDAAAKRRVEALLRELGWAGAIDVGGIAEARFLEALTLLWVRAGIALGRWDHVFDVRY